MSSNYWCCEMQVAAAGEESPGHLAAPSWQLASPRPRSSTGMTQTSLICRARRSLSTALQLAIQAVRETGVESLSLALEGDIVERSVDYP
jgi:hypothetical protein